MIDKIIHKLTETEYDAFISGTGSGTNSRKISQLIRKAKTDIDKDELYKRVFKNRRTTENDYLLRNELSQLKRRIENFIVDHQPTDIPLTAEYYRQYVIRKLARQVFRTRFIRLRLK